MVLWCRYWWFAVIDGLSNQCVLLIGLVLLYYVVLIGCVIGVWYDVVSHIIWFVVLGNCGVVCRPWSCVVIGVLHAVLSWFGLVTPIDSGCFILGIHDSYVFGLF